MKPDDLNDEELLYLVGETDKQLFEAGSDIRRYRREAIQLRFADLRVAIYSL